MNGAHAFLTTLADAGVDTVFANPGTTEMAFVDALGDEPRIDSYLVLHESVASGAADGYARMAGRSAATLLHLGPGLANASSNLHNARRAGSPVLNIVGDHATTHIAFDAPLTSDVETLAKYSGTVLRSSSPGTCGELARDAVGVVRSGKIATAIVATDHQIGPSRVGRPSENGSPAHNSSPAQTDEDEIDSAVTALRQGAALFLGGNALHGDALDYVQAIATGSGCRVVCETFPARLDRGVGRPAMERLPYFPDHALAALAGLPALVVIGTVAPVAFFEYPDTPSSLVPNEVSVIAPDGGCLAVLAALAERIGRASTAPVASTPLPVSGPITPATIGAAVAAAQPSGAIIVDEAATSGLPYFSASEMADPFSHLTLTGGSLGFGLPAAVGAAIACPERPVIAFQADGSGMYSLQALWTMARYQLNVTVVVASNRMYRILKIEGARAGIGGSVVDELTDISGLDWVKIAEGHGVSGERVVDATQLHAAITRAVDGAGPHLIEAVMEG